MFKIMTDVSPEVKNPLANLFKKEKIVAEQEEANLLVVDSTTFKAGNEIGVARVKQFLKEKKSVTILNPKEEQLQLVESLSHLSTRSDDLLPLSLTLVPCSWVNGKQVYQFLELYEPQEVVGQKVLEGQKKKMENKPEAPEDVKYPPEAQGPSFEEQVAAYYQAHQQKILSVVNGTGETEQPPSIPSGVKSTPLQVITDFSFYTRAIADVWKNAPKQLITLTDTVDILVFLNLTGDSGGSPCNQKVAINQRLLFSCGSPQYNSKNTIGWYNTNCELNHQANTTELLINKASPQTPNNSETVTSSTSMSINFAKDGGSAGYTYSTSRSETIKDWEILQTNTSPQEVSWIWYQNNPWCCENPTDTKAFTKAVRVSWDFGNPWYVNQPPALSVTSVQMAPKSTWENDTAVDTLTFLTSGKAWVMTTCTVNEWPEHDFGFLIGNRPFRKTYSLSQLPTTYD
jgi:hypothetical protein